MERRAKRNKLQDMDEESATDTESESKSESGSESESEFESESSDDYSENRRKQKKGMRKMKKQGKDLSQYFRCTAENKSELPVTCGDKKGTLCVEKYENMEECIFSQDQWFLPSKFEKFGGKERSKKWKTSICCDGIPLQKFIEDGCLSSFTRIQVQNEQDKSPESLLVAERLRKRKALSVDSDDSPESSPVAKRLRTRKDRRPTSPISSGEDVKDDDDRDDDDGDDNDSDAIDITKFKGPKLPVNCGSDSGVLHKNRFATGRSGKCIRTKDFWLTPEDFIRLNLPDGAWRKDIVSQGIPLGKLILTRVLEPHTINCDCDICEDSGQHLQNDDVCFVCDAEGDLVCCDECPQAFHPDCHLPAVDVDSMGSEWSCTFCAVKKMKACSQKTKQDVLGSPLSQYTQHCQYLLLLLLHESRTDPCSSVPGYSDNICGSTMLGGVKRNLEKNEYQTVGEFVSDIECVFNNSYTRRENGSRSITSRLKDIFTKESESIFKLQ